MGPDHQLDWWLELKHETPGQKLTTMPCRSKKKPNSIKFGSTVCVHWINVCTTVKNVKQTVG